MPRGRSRAVVAAPRVRAAGAAVLAMHCACAAFAPAPAAAGPTQSSSAAALARAESLLPPEPLSPWTAVDAEIEWLVARGRLPVEALSFRPIDRGELAAWLEGSTPTRAAGGIAHDSTDAGSGNDSVTRERLLAILGEEIARIASGAEDAGLSPARPRGALIHFGGGERRLVFAPHARFMPTFARGRAPHWSDSTRVGFRALFRAGAALSITTGFYAAEVAESGGFADPLIAGTDLILHADEAVLSARLAGMRLRLGRDRHRWGPGASGTLLLAETAAPFDFVEYQVRLSGGLRFLALTGETNRAAGGDSASSYAGRVRYLSAHRLQWEVSPRFSLALSEGARYQRGSPPLLYLAGMLPYTLVERLEMQDEPSDTAEDALRNNVLWSVEAAWRPRPGWLLYGELLIDDIATETSEMPSRGGLQIGCTLAPRWRGCDWTLGAELTRVSNYTYSVYYQDLCQCDWEHQREPLGYAWGPDVAVLLLRAGASPRRDWQARGWMELLHDGSGALGDAWKPASSGCNEGSDPDCGEVDPWTLEAPVTRRFALGGEVRYRPDPLLWLGASLEYRSWRRDGGDRESEGRLRLSASAGL